MFLILFYLIFMPIGEALKTTRKVLHICLLILDVVVDFFGFLTDFGIKSSLFFRLRILLEMLKDLICFLNSTQGKPFRDGFFIGGNVLSDEAWRTHSSRILGAPSYYVDAIERDFIPYRYDRSKFFATTLPLVSNEVFYLENKLYLYKLGYKWYYQYRVLSRLSAYSNRFTRDQLERTSICSAVVPSSFNKRTTAHIFGYDRKGKGYGMLFDEYVYRKKLLSFLDLYDKLIMSQYYNPYWRNFSVLYMRRRSSVLESNYSTYFINEYYNTDINEGFFRDNDTDLVELTDVFVRYGFADQVFESSESYSWVSDTGGMSLTNSDLMYDNAEANLFSHFSLIIRSGLTSFIRFISFIRIIIYISVFPFFYIITILLSSFSLYFRLAWRYSRLVFFVKVSIGKSSFILKQIMYFFTVSLTKVSLLPSYLEFWMAVLRIKLRFKRAEFVLNIKLDFWSVIDQYPELYLVYNMVRKTYDQICLSVKKVLNEMF